VAESDAGEGCEPPEEGEQPEPGRVDPPVKELSMPTVPAPNDPVIWRRPVEPPGV